MSGDGTTGRRWGIASATGCLVLASLVATGCQAGEDATPSGSGGDVVTLAQSLASQQEVVSRLTGSDNGLELRKWLIVDDQDLIAAAMSRYGREPVLEPEPDERFRRNGLRFVTVAIDDLPALLEEMGGASVNVQGWHGQVLQWRALHELSLDEQPQTIAVDGRFRRFEGGRLALLARAWTVQMEDGPYLQLELVPEYRRDARRGTDLRQLLETGQEDDAGEPLRSMFVDVALEAGFAYLLTFETPEVEWTEEGSQDGHDEDGRGAGVGPEVVAPLTLGQRLLWTDAGRSARGVLVFVPRIPRDLYPPELALSRSLGGDHE